MKRILRSSGEQHHIRDSDADAGTARAEDESIVNRHYLLYRARVDVRTIGGRTHA